MCGRYYVDDDTAGQIEKLVYQVNCKDGHRGNTVQGQDSISSRTIKGGLDGNTAPLQDDTGSRLPKERCEKHSVSLQDGTASNAHDICPGGVAKIITKQGGQLCLERGRWGFPEKSLIFNARSETILERPMFREGIRQGRAAIPAAGFYEWNPAKEKNIFYRKGQQVLYMAGCTRMYPDGVHFTILTVPANESVRQVHTRMPLVLDPNEVADWVLDGRNFETLLQKTPCRLERQTDYEQISFFPEIPY